MTFDEAVAQFQDQSVDLLHIDGLHTYEAVRHDFESWLPKLAPGALVLFHDNMETHGDFGVWKFWAELKQKHPQNFEFRHSHGLGVIELPGSNREESRSWLRNGTAEKKNLLEIMTANGESLITKIKSQELEELASISQTKAAQPRAERLLNLEFFFAQEGEKFSENKKISESVLCRESEISPIKIKVKGGASKSVLWRIDPGAVACLIRIHKLEFLGKNGKSIWRLTDHSEEVVIRGTAERLKDDEFVILSFGVDPQVFLPKLQLLSGEELYEMQITLEVLNTNDYLPFLATRYHELESQSRSALAKASAALEQKEKEAAQMQSTLVAKDKEIAQATKIDEKIEQMRQELEAQKVATSKGVEELGDALAGLKQELIHELRGLVGGLNERQDQLQQRNLAEMDALRTSLVDRQRESENNLLEVAKYAEKIQDSVVTPSSYLIPAPFSWYSHLYKMLQIKKPGLLNKTSGAAPKRPGFWRRLERSIRKRRKRWINRIGFDRDWYLKKYPDVGLVGIDPLDHYIEYGQKEGRCKNPHMCTNQELDKAYFPFFQQVNSKRASTVIGILPERLTNGSLSPCAYIRLLLPLHFLAETSKDYRIEILDEDSIFLKKPDIVICQRFWCQKQSQGNQILGEIKKRGIKVIYDLDDDLLSVTNIHADQQLIKERASLVLSMLSYCDLAVFSTSYLKKKYRPLCHNSIVIPNRLGKQIWVNDNALPCSKQNKTLRILYMGTATHDTEVDFLNLVVSRIKNTYGARVSFVMVGCTTSQTKKSGWEVCTPPINATTNYPAFARWLLSQSWDFALAPLIDTEFNRGKSAIKLMDYSALGVPIVASSHSEYEREFVASSGVSLLPNDVESWVQKITFLIENEKERIYQGSQNRQNFEEKFTLEKAEINWEEGLQYLSNLPISTGKKLEVYDFELPASPRIDRKLLSGAFINGKGIEIGALHNPLSVAPGVEVKYLDHLGKTDLYDHYPELREHDLVEVDIIDNGETLKNVADESQDFIIANHFIEHCEDPILALKNIFRVLKTRGVLYMAVPDKRFTFDIDREETPISHLWKDHLEGTQKSRKAHFYEWAKFVERHNGTLPKDASNETIIDRASYLERKNYSIHFHVWCCQSFAEFLEELRKGNTVKCNCLFSGSFPSRQENIFILQKEI
jgi:glycosyltransferase involved in cell wall biosynthesis/SAM-dependent methyltransferase